MNKGLKILPWYPMGITMKNGNIGISESRISPNSKINNEIET
jgi:hypothetical protein